MATKVQVRLFQFVQGRFRSGLAHFPSFLHVKNTSSTKTATMGTFFRPPELGGGLGSDILLEADCPFGSVPVLLLQRRANEVPWPVVVVFLKSGFMKNGSVSLSFSIVSVCFSTS